MAHAAWLTNSPEGGSGNGQVNSSATQNTGRGTRNTTNTYKMTGVTDILQPVAQTGKPEFVTINDISVSKDGGSFTVTGTSNSSKLQLQLGTGAIVASLPANYTAAGLSTANNVAITGDPGNTAQYNFSVALTAAANGTQSSRTQTISATANGGMSAQATISQPAADPSLGIDPTSLTIDWEGNAETTTVTANGNWTVE